MGNDLKKLPIPETAPSPFPQYPEAPPGTPDYQVKYMKEAKERAKLLDTTVEEKQITMSRMDSVALRMSLQDSFRVEMIKNGDMNATKLKETFQKEFAKPSWNPETAVNWDRFLGKSGFTQPDASANVGHRFSPTYNYLEEAAHKFVLSNDEIEKLKENNFMVSNRLGSRGFGTSFLELWSHDIPVYIAPDPILHAWHRSFDFILKGMEEKYASAILFSVLGSMLEVLPKLKEFIDEDKAELDVGSVFSDVEYFLLTGKRLLDPTVDQATQPIFFEQAEMSQALDAILHCKAPDRLPFETENKEKDFSLFTPRGHYCDSAELTSYFQSMMWLAQMDIQLKERDPKNEFKVSCAALLYFAFVHCGKIEEFKSFDKLLEVLAGPTNSLSMEGLGNLSFGSDIVEVSDIFIKAKLGAVIGKIFSSDIGKQSICANPIELREGVQSENLPDELPRAFSFLGQRFQVDSWVTSSICDGDFPHSTVPSSLDVAFAVLKNDIATAVRPEVGKTDYSNKLLALRNAIKQLPEDYWDQSIGTRWIHTLQALSDETDQKCYPEFMRTKASSLKNMDSQLASWTELKHDMVLYLAQSCSISTLCEFPTGYVDPRVKFWDRFISMADYFTSVLQSLTIPESPNEQIFNFSNKFRGDNYCGKWAIADYIEHIQKFSSHLRNLRGIAQKELDQQPLSDDQLDFLKKTVTRTENFGSGGGVRHNGWYPELFYKDKKYCLDSDPIVADIHTIPPADDGDGMVINVATGNCPLMVVAAENGDDRRIYAGPVYSRYEFCSAYGKRITDEDWKGQLRNGQKVPPLPQYTEMYQIHGEIPGCRSKFDLTALSHYERLGSGRKPPWETK